MSVLIDDDLIRSVFDAQAPEYDQVRDLKDAWLFSRIHYLIARNFIAEWGPESKRVLDVGCGTGFQSFLYAGAGADVSGIDISPASIAAAVKKTEQFKHSPDPQLLYPYFKFVRRYNERVKRMIAGREKGIPAIPNFQVGDARSLPFSSGMFDHVNCCGSVLSFVSDPVSALFEISRVLKKGGTYILEVKGSASLDLVWALLTRSLGGSWIYGRLLTQQLLSVKHVWHEHMRIHYPLDTDAATHIDITLFAKRKLREELSMLSLQPWKTFDILSITNLVPSNILHRPNPKRLAKILFSILATGEESFPWLVPGCNIVIMGRKLA